MGGACRGEKRDWDYKVSSAAYTAVKNKEELVLSPFFQLLRGGPELDTFFLVGLWNLSYVLSLLTLLHVFLSFLCTDRYIHVV